MIYKLVVNKWRLNLCGIIGIVSKNQVVDRLIKGLQCLEYRGYDSSGVAAVNNENIFLSKVQEN